MIAPDLRGHGGSTLGPDGAGMTRLVADLLELLEALDVHHAVVVGHSLGGCIVLEAALSDGARLARRADRLVLVSTTGGTAPAAAAGPVKRALVAAGSRAEQRWGALVALAGGHGPQRPPVLRGRPALRG